MIAERRCFACGRTFATKQEYRLSFHRGERIFLCRDQPNCLARRLSKLAGPDREGQP